MISYCQKVKERTSRAKEGIVGCVWILIGLVVKLQNMLTNKCLNHTSHYTLLSSLKVIERLDPGEVND